MSDNDDHRKDEFTSKSWETFENKKFTKKIPKQVDTLYHCIIKNDVNCTRYI